MNDLYFATAEEMEQLDNVAVEAGLQIRQMMELAGFHMLEVFNRESINTNREVVVVCGKGNKGGDGLSAARHLCNHGYAVSVVLADQDLKSDPQHHRMLLEQMDIPILSATGNWQQAVESADVIIDALIGYHLNGAPRGSYSDMINAIHDTESTVISYDIPTGVNPTTGKPLDSHINADTTLSLALPKQLFATDDGKRASGSVYLADIGITAQMYDEIGADTPFTENPPLLKI